MNVCEYTVLGDSVNLAARLVGEAGPGETVLSDAVWRAVGNRRAGSDLGQRRLKGIAEPQRLWRLDGPRETVSAGRLPFIGRELELAQTRANHLYFRRDAIDASLSVGRNGEARRHAIALAKFTEQEPLPFTDIVVRRGLLLADSADGKLSPEGRAELAQLVARAEKAFFLTLIPRMKAASQ